MCVWIEILIFQFQNKQGWCKIATNNLANIWETYCNIVSDIGWKPNKVLIWLGELDIFFYKIFFFQKRYMFSLYLRVLPYGELELEFLVIYQFWQKAYMLVILKELDKKIRR